MGGTKAASQPLATHQTCQCFCGKTPNSFIGPFQRVYNEKQAKAGDMFGATFNDDITWLKQLINAGASPDTCDRNGFCVIHVAANKCHQGALAVIMTNGADVGIALDVKDGHGNAWQNTALQMVPQHFISSTCDSNSDAMATCHDNGDARAHHECKCCNVHKALVALSA